MPNIQLAPSTVNAIRQYIDEGIPLEDLDMSDNTRRRVRVAEQVYERLQQDPMLDVNRCLMRTFGRSRDQAIKDKLVVEMFLDALSGVSKQLITYRRHKLIEQEYRIGTQTGDWKPIDKALTHMEKLANEYEDENDSVVKNTAALPAVLVGVSVVDPSKQELDDKQFVALLKKYDGKPDQIDEMVHQRKEALLLASGRREGEQEAQSANAYEARIAELEAQLAEAQRSNAKQEVLNTLNEMMDND